MSKKPIWFKEGAAADWVTRFTVGDDPYWDTILLPYDLRASRAHARGLVTAGVLTDEEFSALDEAIAGLEARDDLTVNVADEDCHSLIERLLTERVGDIGRRIHTGRSRNDQVLAALRLWMTDTLAALTRGLGDVATALLDIADQGHDRFLPGYTHMQRAMPSSVAVWAHGYAENLIDDLRAVRDARRQVSASPLGSAAGYGVPFLDMARKQVSDELGFDRLQTSVAAVQLSRGKLELHAVHAMVQVAMTLNRLASDLVLFASAEYGFVTLPREYTTGSSIMPQKRNPDVLELARAALHRITAEMQVLISVPSNLSSGYHRDLQLTKEAVMRALLRGQDLVAAMAAVLPGVEFVDERLEAARSADLYATARALDLVRQGVPFRTAYRQTAEAPDAWQAYRTAPAADTYTHEGAPGRTRTAGAALRTELARLIPEADTGA
ncbi:MAG: argininosuccinate lyase [Bacteroidetes bacterium CG12_big_fil_rev_8_21_14_0_65_60_17]|nr:MAG: argininosuccinate lyase [Bacteroidetes bacterium CG12_big_fil_rev_8_21_14_0_65_60_17]